MSDHILSLTDTGLDTALRDSTLPLLLDLWAPWCKPCLALAPQLEALVQLTAGALQIAKLDVQEYPDIMQRFGVRGIPVLLLFKDGREVARSVGLKTQAELAAWLQSEGIIIATPDQPPLQSPLSWASFYGDAALHDFLFRRLQQLAEQGRLDNARHHAWWPEQGNGTVSAALVQHDSLEVFERLTALPSALGLWINMAALHTPEHVRELAQVLLPGRDISQVPLHLMAAWLHDDDNQPWNAWLHNTAANGLRQHWQALATPYIAGEAIAQQEWQALANAAHEQAASTSTGIQPLELTLASIIAQLSPPPSIQDTKTWGALLILLETGMQQGLMISAGFTPEDQAQFEQRTQAFVDSIGDTPLFMLSEEFIEEARSNWIEAHPDLAARERFFYETYDLQTTGIYQQWRTRLLQVLGSTPAFVAPDQLAATAALPDVSGEVPA